MEDYINFESSDNQIQYKINKPQQPFSSILYDKPKQISLLNDKPHQSFSSISLLNDKENKLVDYDDSGYHTYIFIKQLKVVQTK
jgi:hypothetical protein